MGIIHTLEPLSSSLIEEVTKTTGDDIVILDRHSFPTELEICNSIKYLIARDRDSISDILDICPNMNFLFIVSTGIENLPFSKLIARQVTVCNTGGINSTIMSEYVMAYILSHSVRIRENLENQQKHFWKKFQCVDSLRDKTLLVIGAGRTGQKIAEKSKVFGMKTIGIKNHISKVPHFDEVSNLESLDKYLQESDYVVCTIPLTPQTEGLFDYSKFIQMKSTAIFVNISRGKIVNQSDIKRALANGLLSAAVLDVYETEPIASDDDLWDTPNLIMTPHSSGRLENFMDVAISDYFIPNFQAFINGNVLLNKVNLHDGY